MPAAILFASPFGRLNMTATDILVCPKQPNAIDILYGGELRSDRDEPMRMCVPRDSAIGGSAVTGGLFVTSRPRYLAENG